MVYELNVPDFSFQILQVSTANVPSQAPWVLLPQWDCERMPTGGFVHTSPCPGGGCSDTQFLYRLPFLAVPFPSGNLPEQSLYLCHK